MKTIQLEKMDSYFTGKLSNNKYWTLLDAFWLMAKSKKSSNLKKMYISQLFLSRTAF